MIAHRKRGEARDYSFHNLIGRPFRCTNARNADIVDVELDVVATKQCVSHPVQVVSQARPEAKAAATKNHTLGLQRRYLGAVGDEVHNVRFRFGEFWTKGKCPRFSRLKFPDGVDQAQLIAEIAKSVRAQEKRSHG
jgi:hypothetical protein